MIAILVATIFYLMPVILWKLWVIIDAKKIKKGEAIQKYINDVKCDCKKL